MPHDNPMEQPTRSPAAQSTWHVRKSFARGATLMVAMRAITRFSSIFSTAILARLLTPSDFGLVVLGSSVLVIAGSLSELSLGAALIRMRTPALAHYNTAWTIGVIRSLLVAVVVVAVAPLVADGMHEKRVTAILWMLAATTIIQSFESIRLVDFQIGMQFDGVFRYQLATRVTAFIATLSLAFLLRSYWALVISSFITAIVTVCYSYILRPHRPRLELTVWRDLFHFSKWALLSSYMIVLDNYSIIFFVTWLGGARQLGMYQVSAQIAAVPASEVAAPIRPPLYAAFSRLLDDPPALARTFVEGFSFMMLVILPMSLGIFVTAPMISPLALGPKWLDASPMIEAVVFYALFDAIGHYPGNIFVAKNRQGRQMALYAIFLTVRLPVALLGGWAWGALGAVYGMALTALFGAIFWFVACMPMLETNMRVVLASIWRSVAAGCVMVAALLVLRASWPVQHGDAAVAMQLLAFVAIGAALHIGAQTALWLACGRPAGAEMRALDLAQRMARRIW